MFNEKFWVGYMKVFDVMALAIPYQEMINDIIDELNAKDNENILDAGSGTGILSVEMKKKCKPNIYALDNSQVALNIHKKKDPKTFFIKANLNKKLPFSDNYFDKIVCILTLHSIPKKNRVALISEFNRILKSKGKIVLVSPYVGFSSTRIFFEHFKRDLKRSGVLKSFLSLAKNTIPVIKMFYYNWILSKEGGGIDIMLNKEEQKELLKLSRFVNISETRLIYAQSAIINSAFKN